MLNKVQLIGRLGNDPEIRFMPNGNAVCSISLATSLTWKDRNTGERREETEWHRIVIFGKLAEIAGEYLKKGSQAYFEGRIKTRKWEKDGQTHYSTEIICEEMKMLGSSAGSGNNSGGNKPSSQGGHQPQSHQSAPPPPSYEDWNDDIPF